MRVTIPSTVALALVLHLAGCDKSPVTPHDADAVPIATLARTQAPLAPEDAAPTPSLPPAAMTSTPPGPTDRDPAHALAYWREAMEKRDWIAARGVFGDHGAQSGMTPEAFAATWSKYRIVDITVGKGEQDAGAGSSYYDVPVTITGLTSTNKPYNLAGRLTLRRVNDVDGATAEQLRWHIERSTLRP